MKSTITSALLASVLMIASQSVLAQTAPASGSGLPAGGGGSDAAGARPATAGATGGITPTALVVGAVVIAGVIALANDDSTTGTTGTTGTN